VHDVEEKILKAILKDGIIRWVKSQTPKHGLAQDFK